VFEHGIQNMLDAVRAGGSGKQEEAK